MSAKRMLASQACKGCSSSKECRGGLPAGKLNLHSAQHDFAACERSCKYVTTQDEEVEERQAPLGLRLGAFVYYRFAVTMAREQAQQTSQGWKRTCVREACTGRYRSPSWMFRKIEITRSPSARIALPPGIIGSQQNGQGTL